MTDSMLTSTKRCYFCGRGTLLLLIVVLAQLALACQERQRPAVGLPTHLGSFESLKCSEALPHPIETDEFLLDKAAHNSLLLKTASAFGLSMAELIMPAANVYSDRKYSSEETWAIFESFLFEIVRRGSAATEGADEIKFIFDPACDHCAVAFSTLETASKDCDAFPSVRMLPFSMPSTRGYDTVVWLLSLRESEDVQLFEQASRESLQLLPGGHVSLSELKGLIGNAVADDPHEEVNLEGYFLEIRSINPTGRTPEVLFRGISLQERFGSEFYFEPLLTPENLILSLRVISAL